MTARAGIWKRKREDLENRRDLLFKRYQKTPNELRLALEIRVIDDQIAECTHHIELESQKDRASAGGFSHVSDERRMIWARTTLILTLSDRGKNAAGRFSQ